MDFDAVIFADACYKDLAHHFRGKCHIKVTYCFAFVAPVKDKFEGERMGGRYRKEH